eukprot:COSAG05_NODE_180_length_14817_cov_423.925262_20_plen_109_part_00
MDNAELAESIAEEKRLQQAVSAWAGAHLSWEHDGRDLSRARATEVSRQLLQNNPRALHGYLIVLFCVFVWRSSVPRAGGIRAALHSAAAAAAAAAAAGAKPIGALLMY